MSKRFGSQHHGSGGFKDEWQSLVKDEFTANEQAVQIGVVDAAGIVIASTAMLHPSTPIDISDREHFRVHKQSQKDALFIISRSLVAPPASRPFNLRGPFGEQMASLRA